MYFSLITPKLGYEREAALEWAQGSYAQHQWLWSFLKAPEGSPRDFLFRRRDCDNQLPGFYLVSVRKPQTISESWEAQSKIFEPQLHCGQRLAFELRANPTVSKKSNGKSRRSDVVMDAKKRLLMERGYSRWDDWAEQEEKPSIYELVQSTCQLWLEKRGEYSGFQLADTSSDSLSKNLRVDAYQQHRTKKGQKNDANKDIRYSTVDFSGELEVTDVDLFRQMLMQGLGPAKAFGCGLMLIRRIQ